MLSTRVSLWEVNKGSSGGASKESVSGYKKDLSTLRYLIQFIPNAKTKLYLYEGSYRLICGSNPLTANLFFERALRKRRNTVGMICTTDERNPMSLSDQNDIASVLFHMAKHMPVHISHPAEREGYVREANAILGRKNKKLLL